MNESSLRQVPYLCLEVSLIVMTEPLFAAVAAVCCIGETFSFGDCAGLGQSMAQIVSLFRFVFSQHFLGILGHSWAMHLIAAHSSYLHVFALRLLWICS